MKHVLSLLILCSIFVGGANAQSKQKFGHIDSQKLLEAMPERKAAELELQSYAQQLEAQLQSMMTEFESKLADFQSNELVMSDVIKQSKTEELESLNGRIQKFQQDAQNSIVKKENELVKPILDKAKAAIEAVAGDKGYSYVFDTSSGTLLYQPESDNILPFVITHLGLDAPAPKPAPAPAE